MNDQTPGLPVDDEKLVLADYITSCCKAPDACVLSCVINFAMTLF